MIGHCTVLIEADGKKILTDPYFGTWGNLAYTRISPSSRQWDEIPKPDLVLVSHNHFDHTDSRFFRSLDVSIPVIVPAEIVWRTRLKGVRSPVGMHIWEEYCFQTVRITAVPAVHLGATRGYIIQAEGKTIYFSGDTFYSSFMKEIGRRFRLDASLIPVTTYRIPMTMGENGAVRATLDLRPDIVIPVHLGLKPRLCLMRTGHTPEGFREKLSGPAPDIKVVILEPGECWNIT